MCLLHRLQHDRDFPAARRQYHHRRRGVLQSALVSPLEGSRRALAFARLRSSRHVTRPSDPVRRLRYPSSPFPCRQLRRAGRRDQDECTQHVQRPQSTTRAHARPQGGLLITLYTPTTSRTNGTDSVRRSVASSDGKCSSKTGSSKRRTGASTARAPLHAVRARRIHSLAVAARRVPGMIKVITRNTCLTHTLSLPTQAAYNILITPTCTRSCVCRAWSPPRYRLRSRGSRTFTSSPTST